MDIRVWEVIVPEFLIGLLLVTFAVSKGFRYIYVADNSSWICVVLDAPHIYPRNRS